MSTYAQPSEQRTLRKIERAKWQAFRREMIERDGGRCARCGRAETDGHVMHVHHKHYVRGRMPWQYNYNECELLCGGCHAAEHDVAGCRLYDRITNAQCRRLRHHKFER